MMKLEFENISFIFYDEDKYEILYFTSEMPPNEKFKININDEYDFIIVGEENE